MIKLILSIIPLNSIVLFLYIFLLLYALIIYIFNKNTEKGSLKKLTPIDVLQLILPKQTRIKISIQRYITNIQYTNKDNSIEIDSKFAHQTKLNNIVDVLIILNSVNSSWVKNSRMINILFNLLWITYLISLLFENIYKNIEYIGLINISTISLLIVLLSIDLSLRDEVCRKTKIMIKDYDLTDPTENSSVNKYLNLWKISNFDYIINPLMFIINFFKKKG